MLIAILFTLVFYSCIAQKKSVADQPGYTGAWATDCIPLGFGGSLRVFAEFKISSVHVTSQLYHDLTCKLLVEQGFSQRDYKLSGVFQDGHKIDYTTKQEMFSFNTVESVSDANKNFFYGYSDWKIGEKRTIAGRKRTNVDDETPEIGSKSYSIIKRKDDRLYYGNSSLLEGEKPETRPIEFDEELFLIKSKK